MEDIKRKIDRKRQELDDLVVELCAKAKLNDHHPNFGIKERCDKAAIWCQAANGKLFYARMALGH